MRLRDGARDRGAGGGRTRTPAGAHIALLRAWRPAISRAGAHGASHEAGGGRRR